MLGLETKRPGKKPTKIQYERCREMNMYGFPWAKVDTYDDVEFTLCNFARKTIGERLLPRAEWEKMPKEKY